MGSLRPMKDRAQRRLLRWRTRWGRATAVRHLDLLATAAQAKGYRCVKLYRTEEYPHWLPMLWVFAFGPEHHVRVAVRVRAVPGGTWAYYDAARGRFGYLAPCGDVKHAIGQVDALLKHRMFPSTW
ncbi:hypothetical protein ACFOY4_22745 [Actinomadura syzygii]|uniref:Uncharacterized protein n=1 Tax=Actinomadura syzygii TaxID=1427538 RepID=A0A5D0UJM6_9ACTN|nr:hypothetical protein [Actinomadura syzygii]TYC18721.1 hypothetical protein FXF65_02975 [Actinomadura syzygii]